jgi:hypothetical protein
MDWDMHFQGAGKAVRIIEMYKKYDFCNEISTIFIKTNFSCRTVDGVVPSASFFLGFICPLKTDN